VRRLSLRVAGLGALTLIAGCASAGNPPGGPERHTPPAIVSISPDSGATNVNIRNFEIKFDEVVSDRPAASGATELNQIFLISPRDGDPYVSWHRDHIDVRPRKGFRANQAYRVTMLPGLADLRNNIRKDGVSIVFSTGPDFPTLGIVGRLFDWDTQKPVNGGYIEAMLLSDTTLVYVTATDTLGGFEVGPLGPGRYRVRGLIDQNTNRVVDRGEKWDTTTVAVTDARPSTELLAIERDTVAPNFSRIIVDDSVTLHVMFDRPLSPALGLQPALFRIQRADSVALDITAVQWGTAYDRAKQVTDSIHADSVARAAARARADSARARGDTTHVQPPPPLPPLPPSARGAPPPPKPHLPPPDRVIVLKVSPKTLFVVGNSYRLSARGVPNLLGYSRPISRVFEVPKPPPRDTTRRAPRDTTRKSPVAPGKPPAKPPLGLLLR
jgi:hypothetical protein